MHVVEIDGDKEAVGQQPCGGVCKADGGVADPAHDGKADKAAGDRLKHPCKHGLLREADALNEESEHFPERAQLYARIDLRVELMYAQGLAQEVRALLDSGVPDRATSLQAIGYKQVVQALEEGLPPEAALGTIQQATRRYAKRQMTWFRANPAVQWLDASAGADEIFRAALQKAADFDSGI